MNDFAIFVLGMIPVFTGVGGIFLGKQIGLRYVASEEELVDEIVRRKLIEHLREYEKTKLNRIMNTLGGLNAEHPSDVSKATDAPEPGVPGWFGDNSQPGTTKPK